MQRKNHNLTKLAWAWLFARRLEPVEYLAKYFYIQYWYGQTIFNILLSLRSSQILAQSIPRNFLWKDL